MYKVVRAGCRPIGRAVLSVAAILILLSMLAACSVSQAPGEGGRLSIATGGTGGVYFVYGGALADQITQNIEGV